MSEMPAPGTVPEWDQADRLAKALQHRGIKVQQMADYLGVSRNTIGNYLSRRSKPDKRTLLLWAMKTGVPREWLEDGKTPPDDPDGGGVRREGIEPPTRWLSTSPSHGGFGNSSADFERAA
jgi:transcriptional regulator with XRE-family HTH domain